MYYWSLAWRILSITLLVCEMSTSSGSVPNATFRGLRQACVWFPQVLGPHPEETNIGEEIWGVCVCVCVCVCAVSLIYFPQVCFLCSHSLWADGERKLCRLVWSSVCWKYTFMMNINVGEEADRQTVGGLSIPQEFGTVQWLNWRWFWPQETFDNIWRYSGVVRRIEERSELLVSHRMEARGAIKQPMIETTGHPVIQSQVSVVSGLRPPGDVRSWPPGHWGSTWWGGSNKGSSRPVFVWGTSYFRNIS